MSYRPDGYHLLNTAGGCTAWIRKYPEFGDLEIWITDEGGTCHPDAIVDVNDRTRIAVGLRDLDGSELRIDYVCLRHMRQAIAGMLLHAAAYVPEADS